MKSLVFLLAFSTARLFAQGGCPPISFATAGTLPIADGTSFTGLARQVDGSYTGYKYGRGATSTTVVKTATLPGFQQNFVNCTIAAPRTFQPVLGRPNIGTIQLGTSSRNPIIADMGTGANVILGIYHPRYSNQLLVGTGTVDGTPGTGTAYPVGVNPENLLIADFNGDGKKDVAVVNQGAFTSTSTGSVSILLGNGDGTLRAAVNYGVGNIPNSATAFDFNGDGRPDLAVVNGGSNNVSVLLNNGDGTFRAAVNYATAPGPVSVAAGDFTGDGTADLIIAAGFNPHSISVFPGNGNGTFGTAISTTVAEDGRAIATGDFNKDGRMDVAVAGFFGGTIGVLLGAGNGMFPTQYHYVTAPDAESLLATDFDGDGNLDLIVGAGHPDAITPHRYAETMTVLFGKGDGTFFAAPDYPGYTLSSLVLADFNGDGKQDLAAGNSSPNQGGTSVALFLGRGGDDFQSSIPVSILDQFGSMVGVYAMTAGDFNGDGKQDLAVLQGGNRVYVALGYGNGGFRAATNFTVGTASTNLLQIVAADFNKDGKMDLAVAGTVSGSSESQGMVYLLPGNGNGTFQTPVSYTIGSGVGGIAAGDFNGDTRPDLVVTSPGVSPHTTNPGALYVLLANSGGTFATPVSFPAGADPTAISVGDINGDGKLDLVITAESATFQTDFQFKLAILIGAGNGTFAAPSLINTDFGPSSVAIADLNNDGKKDLVVAHCCGDTDMTYSLGNGDGTFQNEVHFAAGGSPGVVLAQDFNGDGKPDLAIGLGLSNPGGSVTAFLNISGGATQTCSFSLNRYSASASALGDTEPVQVTASASSCSWTASSAAPWVTLSAAAGQGSGPVRFTVAANSTAAARSGTITVAGYTVAIAQAGMGCSYSLTTQGNSVVAGGGNGTVTVSTAAGCASSAAAAPTWIAITDNAGGLAGPGAYGFNASPNPNADARTGSVSVNGQLTQVLQRGAAPAQAFTDVPLTHVYFDYISLMALNRITSGCSPTTYCPDGSTTRGQMAVFIIRALMGDEFAFTAPPYFTDVPLSHPYFKYIQKMRDLGITTGCTATMYCPDGPVTRGQMAVFIVRARLGIDAAAQFAYPATPYFTDVPASHPYFSFIQKMRDLGITSGCTANTYCPDDPNTRGQMAVFIIRGLLTP